MFRVKTAVLLLLLVLLGFLLVLLELKKIAVVVLLSNDDKQHWTDSSAGMVNAGDTCIYSLNTYRIAGIFVDPHGQQRVCFTRPKQSAPSSKKNAGVRTRVASFNPHPYHITRVVHSRIPLL